MPDQKIDNLLNLAMDATSEERAKSENLNVGYDSSERLWDVIVKYSGPESRLGGEGIQVVPLLGGYAVVTLPESEMRMEAAGYYICGIRAYPEILRKATQKERNIRKKKLIRRLHLGKPKAGALFHPEMSVDMERQCSELRREMGRYRRV